MTGKTACTIRGKRSHNKVSGGERFHGTKGQTVMAAMRNLMCDAFG